jgi:uncharacterized protein YggL (DUF469 family)
VAIRRRLRKKKHLAEFQEFGVSIDLQLRSVDHWESVFEALSSFLHENHLLGACGGDSKTTELSCYADLGTSSVRDKNLATLTAFLEAQKGVASYETGTVHDAHYADPFEE